MIPRRPGIATPERKKLAYREALTVSDKTPKGQVLFIKGWNEMRDRLLEVGEMERK